MRVKSKCNTFIGYRYGVSDHATAAIELSILQDTGLNTDMDLCRVIENNNIKGG